MPKIKSPFPDQLKSYGLILITMLIALIIVYLILNSNDQRLQEKQDSVNSSSEISPEINALGEKLKKDPANVSLNIQMGNHLFDAGNFSGAIGYYKQALQTDSLNVAVWIDMAVCFFNQQDYTAAINNMNTALRIDPNYKKGLFNIGIMYMNIGKLNDARFYWDKLIQMYDGSEEAERAKQLIKNM